MSDSRSRIEKKVRVEMLERELHGIDLELQVARTAHIKDTQRIVDLERERSDLVQELNRDHPLQLPGDWE